MGEGSGQIEPVSEGRIGEGGSTKSGIDTRPLRKKQHDPTDAEHQTDDRTPDPDEELRPPLPPRPKRDHQAKGTACAEDEASQFSKSSPRPPLRTTATTALSLTDIQTHSFPDGSRETYSSLSARSRTSPGEAFGAIDRHLSRSGSETGDTSSIRSILPNPEAGGDVESLLGEVLGNGNERLAWKRNSRPRSASNTFEAHGDDGLPVKFSREFDALDELKEDGSNEGM